MTPVLEFADIVRSFGRGDPVLNGVTFSVAPGEVTALLGRNGAGKTTLIQIAMGMLFPDRGSVRVFGMSPTAEPVAVKRRIGYVSEQQVFPPTASSGGVIALHRRLFPDWDSGLEYDLLHRFGLSRVSNIGKLSKGQARQTALLCAVCHRPELLILDEPAGGLDPAARREFLETSIQLLNREGSSILFSSHHMSDVERLGGRVVLLEDGKVRLDRELDHLREDCCVALIPGSALRHHEALAQMPGCLGVRAVDGTLRAVFDKPPDAARQQIESVLGVDGIGCARLPLEELFVELVGDWRKREASWPFKI